MPHRAALRVPPIHRVGARVRTSRAAARGFADAWRDARAGCGHPARAPFPADRRAGARAAAGSGLHELHLRAG
jgi:hypothetical protein